jgi:hypothetical protein
MLTDTKLRSLKAQDKLYKVNDRDGLYVAVPSVTSIAGRCLLEVLKFSFAFLWCENVWESCVWAMPAYRPTIKRPHCRRMLCSERGAIASIRTLRVASLVLPARS